MMLSVFDQPVRLTEQETKVFEEVDNIVGRAITIGDPTLAFEFGSHLRRRQAVEGLALAKLLYRINESWDLFRSAGVEDDMVTVVHTEMGVAPETTKKYIRMWQSIFENDGIDEGIKRILMGRPIGDLLLLTAAARDGSLTDDEMHEAAVAPDRAALRDIIRQKRGEKTSSVNAIKLIMTMQDMESMPAYTLYAKRGDERAVLAHFITPVSGLAEEAIEKIINKMGILERYGS